MGSKSFRQLMRLLKNPWKMGDGPIGRQRRYKGNNGAEYKKQDREGILVSISHKLRGAPDAETGKFITDLGDGKYDKILRNDDIRTVIEENLYLFNVRRKLREALDQRLAETDTQVQAARRRLITDVSTPLCEYQPAPALISPETASLGLLLVPVAALGYFLVRRFNKPRQESSEIADLNEVVIEPQA